MAVSVISKLFLKHFLSYIFRFKEATGEKRVEINGKSKDI